MQRDPHRDVAVTEHDEVRVEVLRLDPNLPLPTYACDGDAGLDLRASAPVRLRPGQRSLVPTGLAVAIPRGYVGLIHPRSGLATRLGLGMVNAPGTIDSGYRGEIMVNLVNHDPCSTIELRRGDRIAQLVLQRVAHAILVEVAELPSSARGAAGHGASGLAGQAH